MRLFPRVDGGLDRQDRGGLLTLPFDLAIFTPAVRQLSIQWLECFAATAAAASAFTPCTPYWQPFINQPPAVAEYLAGAVFALAHIPQTARGTYAGAGMARAYETTPPSAAESAAGAAYSQGFTPPGP